MKDIYNKNLKTLKKKLKNTLEIKKTSHVN